MLCIKCGNKIPDGSSFCNRCGNPVVAEPEIVPEPPVMVLETPVILPEAPVIPEQPPVMPEPPVNQETVIVPQFPGESNMQQPSLNQATIVVPEVFDDLQVPETDSVEEMYPEQPEKKSKVGLIIGLVVAGVLLLATIVVVILGIMNNWWRNDAENDRDLSAITDSTDSTGSTDSTEPEGPAEPEQNLTADQVRQTLTEFETYGLFLYLSDGFDEVERGDDGATFESADLDLLVFWGPVANGDDALSYARAYETQEKDNFDKIERSNQYGTPYTVAYKGNKVTLTGFYVQNGYGWKVQILTREFETRKDELINYVTLAKPDSEFETPAVEDEVVTQEFTFLGLGLTMDSTLVPTKNDDYCIYQNDKMMVVVQFTATPPAGSSKEYAESVLDDNGESAWAQVYMDSLDEKFYYVAMADDNGMVTLKGMYLHEGAAWFVEIDTEEGEKYAEAMMEYITSGRIIPDEVPKKDIQVEFNKMQLTLPGSFKESYRGDDYVYLTDGDLDVYIESGVYTNFADIPASAEARAQQQYSSLKELWPNVEQGSMMNVPYLTCWDDALSMVQGHYLVDNTWWVIRVEAVHTSRLSQMKTISASGVAPEPTEKPFRPGNEVQRDRITMTGQLTTEYEGLQVSYAPDWVPDTFSGGSGDFKGDYFTMYTIVAQLEFYGVGNALEMVWQEAKYSYEIWDHYEVGIAGGVPYLLLWTDMGSYQVLGAYDDGTHCWTINLQFSGSDLVDQAIWYATAGVVL